MVPAVSLRGGLVNPGVRCRGGIDAGRIRRAGGCGRGPGGRSLSCDRKDGVGCLAIAGDRPGVEPRASREVRGPVSAEPARGRDRESPQRMNRGLSWRTAPEPCRGTAPVTRPALKRTAACPVPASAGGAPAGTTAKSPPPRPVPAAQPVPTAAERTSRPRRRCCRRCAWARPARTVPRATPGGHRENRRGNRGTRRQIRRVRWRCIDMQHRKGARCGREQGAAARGAAVLGVARQRNAAQPAAVGRAAVGPGALHCRRRTGRACPGPVGRVEPEVATASSPPDDAAYPPEPVTGPPPSTSMTPAGASVLTRWVIGPVKDGSPHEAREPVKWSGSDDQLNAAGAALQRRQEGPAGGRNRRLHSRRCRRLARGPVRRRLGRPALPRPAHGSPLLGEAGVDAAISLTKRSRCGCSRSRMSSRAQWKW